MSAKPCKNDDAGYFSLAANVDHPDGFIDVEVVEDRAGVQVLLVGQSIDRPGSVSVLPLVAHVTLQLTTITHPRFLVERKILNCL